MRPTWQAITAQIDEMRQHLAAVHGDYLIAFDRLVERARDQRDE
jgi:hypothetical protein